MRTYPVTNRSKQFVTPDICDPEGFGKKPTTTWCGAKEKKTRLQMNLPSSDGKSEIPCDLCSNHTRHKRRHGA